MGAGIRKHPSEITAVSDEITVVNANIKKQLTKMTDMNGQTHAGFVKFPGMYLASRMFTSYYTSYAVVSCDQFNVNSINGPLTFTGSGMIRVVTGAPYSSSLYYSGHFLYNTSVGTLYTRFDASLTISSALIDGSNLLPFMDKWSNGNIFRSTSSSCNSNTTLNKWTTNPYFSNNWFFESSVYIQSLYADHLNLELWRWQ